MTFKDFSCFLIQRYGVSSDIRPIVRGKAGSSVEFGAKISVSEIEGYVFLDELNWENYNESKYLIEQVEKYYKYLGFYP